MCMSVYEYLNIILSMEFCKVCNTFYLSFFLICCNSSYFFSEIILRFLKLFHSSYIFITIPDKHTIGAFCKYRRI